MHLRLPVTGLLCGLLILACGGAPTGSGAAPPTPGASTADHEPSFDCRKADTSTQLRICASRDLSALDRSLADAWKLAKAASTDKDALLRDQKDWLGGNARCADDACLSARYLERIGYLKGLATAGAGRASVTGRWTSANSGISFLEKPSGTVRFSLFATGGGGLDGPNMGSASGSMPLHDNVATYTRAE